MGDIASAEGVAMGLDSSHGYLPWAKTDNKVVIFARQHFLRFKDNKDNKNNVNNFLSDDFWTFSPSFCRVNGV